MERDSDLRPAIERFEEIQELAPERSIYWSLQNVFNEAQELLVTDPELTPVSFKKELADVQLALWRVLLSAGISRVDFYERILPEKEDLIINRLKDTLILSRGGAMTRETAYEG